MSVHYVRVENNVGGWLLLLFRFDENSLLISFLHTNDKLFFGRSIVLCLEALTLTIISLFPFMITIHKNYNYHFPIKMIGKLIFLFKFRFNNSFLNKIINGSFKFSLQNVIKNYLQQ